MMKEAVITYYNQGDINNPNDWETILCLFECETELWDAEDNLIASGNALCIIKTEITN